MTEQPRTAGKFDAVLTEEQKVAVAVGLIAGKTQNALAKELGIPRSSVGDVARDPATKELVSEERAKLSLAASRRRSEIARARAAGLPTPEPEERSMVFDQTEGRLRPFQGGRLLGVMSLPTAVDPRPPYWIGGGPFTERSGLPSAYADDNEYMRTPREPNAEGIFALLRDVSGSFSKVFDPTDATDIGNAVGLAADLYPRISSERLRTTLQDAAPGDVIVLPELLVPEADD